MKRRWIFWILVIAFAYVVISQFSAIKKLVQTLMAGQWQWVAIAALLQVIYFITYTVLYQSAFLTVGVKSRLNELLPVTFASIFLNVAAPSGGASSAALFADDAARRGESAARTAVGYLLVMVADFCAFLVVLVGGMTRMPADQEAVRREFSKEPHKGVNPDEVVAIGAAIQAGVLGGEVKDILLLDVTPLTLSVETYGNVATPIIERNTTIPTRTSQIFSTASDSQTTVEVHVLQGERPMARDNKSLGKFTLDGIPAAPRGIPQIEVPFDIDANGILKVTAQDKATGRSQHITITASSGLSEAEIERMRKEAEEHAEEDRKHKELVEARNRGDSLVYTAERTLKDLGDKVPGDLRRQTEDAIKKVREVLDKEDVEALNKATDALGEVIQKVGAAAYQQGQPAGGPGTPPPGDTPQGGDSGSGGGPSGGSGSSGDDVVEGEFKSV